MAAQSPPFALQNSSAHSAALFRQAASSLLQADGVLAPAELAVTAQSTPNMSVQVAAGRVWANGTQVANIAGQKFSTQAAYFGINDAPATVTIATANATNPRIDVVYAAVQDSFYSGATNALVIGVVTGTPAASPAVPAAPSNATVLAQVAVAANATSITNGNITSFTTAATGQAAVTGAPLIFTSGTRPTNVGIGQFGWETDTGNLLIATAGTGTSTTWKKCGNTNHPSGVLGDAFLALETITPASYTDFATVTATSSGGTCVARIWLQAFNASSGADRSLDVQVLCDSTVIGTMTGILIPLANVRPVDRFLVYSSTPAAGSHTWHLQARASVASAVYMETAMLTVVES